MKYEVAKNGETKSVLDAYKFSRYPDKQTAFFASQICIANLIKAFSGMFTRQQIIDAVGKATNPNAVSCAVRSHLPHFKVC